MSTNESRSPMEQERRRELTKQQQQQRQQRQQREQLLLVAHHNPGRLRLRSRALEGVRNSARAGEACAALRALTGVSKVEARSETGSILVLYDPTRVIPETLIDTVAKTASLTFRNGTAKHGDEDRLAYIAIDFVHEANVLVQELTHHRADLRVLVPAVLAGLATVSAAERGVRLPSWDNLLFWSYSVFVAVNKRAIDESDLEDDGSLGPR